MLNQSRLRLLAGFGRDCQNRKCLATTLFLLLFGEKGLVGLIPLQSLLTNSGLLFYVICSNVTMEHFGKQ